VNQRLNVDCKIQWREFLKGEGGCARDFRVSIHLLALNRQSLNSQFLSAGKEKTSKKPF